MLNIRPFTKFHFGWELAALTTKFYFGWCRWVEYSTRLVGGGAVTAD